MTDRNQLRRITKLGIGQFESADEVKRRQDDLLERLKANMWFRNRSKALARCTADHCGSCKMRRSLRVRRLAAPIRANTSGLSADEKDRWPHL